MSSVALIIIYNHPHEENIPVLEKIYRNRFTDIYHLVPAYRGTQSNVIPVYERSDLFQHYLPQALPEFFHEKYEHYLFIADDLIINPRMNENNYAEYLNLDRDTCFITKITNLYDIRTSWAHTPNGICFNRKHSLFNLEHELPEPKKASTCLNFMEVYTPSLISELMPLSSLSIFPYRRFISVPDPECSTEISHERF